MDTFDSLRPHIEDYLLEQGINLRRRFRCLNPEHFDRNPSMGYDAKRHKVHCFACGVDYDLFDLLAIEKNLSSPGEALAEASRRYGHGDRSAVGAPSRAYDEAPAAQDASLEPQYVEQCFSHRGETDYFVQRGLSMETVERFRLGFDPKRKCVVLPCGAGGVVRRSVEEKRYLNEKGRPSPLFQAELLLEDAPVFLTEGTFDALSAEELGFHACALNGSGNREKAAGLLRSRKKPGALLILTDNDAAGEAWASALAQEIPWAWRCPALPQGKDLSEYLTADREGAARYLAECVETWKEQQPPPYQDQSAAGRMQALEDYIAKRANQPALLLGFPMLDKALDGGLYDGLYVLGAVSSLGKTAFCMQIADQLAKQEQDVLVFSLEMSAFELMARSVSRETFIADGTKGKKLARTVRGILDGKRYKKYSKAVKTHLEAAKRTYEGYAGHIWFREGDHETGMEEIRKEVRRHIEETGRKPVVLIDYLQIIAPADVHFTDKQNLDRTVCALKKLSRGEELTILAISSFNRENYNVAATMSAFKESGGIDYSADVLLGLQAQGAGSRNFDIDAEKRKDPRELELVILKNRTAGLGKPIPFRYYPAFSYFEEA